LKSSTLIVGGMIYRWGEKYFAYQSRYTTMITMKAHKLQHRTVLYLFSALQCIPVPAPIAISDNVCQLCKDEGQYSVCHHESLRFLQYRKRKNHQSVHNILFSYWVGYMFQIESVHHHTLYKT